MTLRMITGGRTSFFPHPSTPPRLTLMQGELSQTAPASSLLAAPGMMNALKRLGNRFLEAISGPGTQQKLSSTSAVPRSRLNIIESAALQGRTVY